MLNNVKTIGVVVPIMYAGVRRMLNALGEIMKVRFEEHTFDNDNKIDALLFQGGNWESQHSVSNLNKPFYAVIGDDQRIPCGESSTLTITRNAAIPKVLHGKQIKSKEIKNLMGLAYKENMKVIATKAGAPVWTINEKEGKYQYYVTLDIPELNENENVFEYFNENKFLQLLPFIIFLQNLTKDKRWEKPILRSCFMFDDPNIHWKTYGFIDFTKLVEHAQNHNYHVAFATIPRDLWYFHKPTALLFKNNCDKLSMLCHGNDHIANELARNTSDEEILKTLRQALNRIYKFEQLSGIEVSRVMIPPHGACSENSMRVMAKLGFEAACSSAGSLRKFNRKASWLRTIGMRSSDIIADLPVYSRFAFSKEYKNRILIAALLNQPIIIRGHNYDVADGLKLLADTADFINSLGKVKWYDMKGISRSEFVRCYEGEILRIRMLTKRIEIIVPHGTTKIMVELPMLKGVEAIQIIWRYVGNNSVWKDQKLDQTIAVRPNHKIEIAIKTEILPANKNASAKKIAIWPVIRRQLTEARDRLAPVKKRAETYLNIHNIK